MEFPNDIVVEILIRLPARSVFKFRSVSKNWLALISDASFIARFVRKPKPQPFIFLFQIHSFKQTLAFLCTDRTLDKLTSHFPTVQLADLKIASIANDLILYQSDYYQPLYFISNPFTRQCVPLPLPRRRRGVASPKSGLITYAKDGVVVSYSVVSLIKEGDRPTYMEIYSSEKGECRYFQPRKFSMEHLKIDTRPCVVYKDALHWLCDRVASIFVYNPRNDYHRMIPTPNEVCHVKGMNAVVGTSCGNLYYFEISGICLEVDKKLPRWKLWVMSDYEKGKWCLEEEGGERDMEGFVGDFLSTHSPLHPIALHPSRRDVLVYFWYEGYVLTFDTKIGWFEDKMSLFSPAGVVSSWEIYSLFMPLCSTRIPRANNQ